MGTNITGIGNANAIGFKSRVTGGTYFPPELKDALVGVWSAYGKSNDSTDRNVIKNKIKDRGGDFELLNFNYKEGSGYGKYNITLQDFPYRENVASVSDNKAVFSAGGQLLLPYPSMNKDMPSFRIKVSGLSETYHFRYYYRSSNGVQDSINMAKDGYYDLPICYNVQSSSDGTNCGFANNGSDVVTIEQIPQFQGAVVTDGIDDLITSTKTMQEMGITDKVTVVSMIHQIDLNSTYTIATTNYIENSNSREHVRSDVYNYGKTGIYGYSASLINNTKSDIKNILGDEADYYVKSTNSLQTIFDAKFSVVGRISELTEASQLAWYWTIIANKVLTTDQINQVIAYFNLDRTLKPDILCDVKKQGITNENHAEFGDKLIDFSGNGRDIQLNNLAWDGDSGIGKYNYPNWKVTATIANTYSDIVKYPTVNGTYSINVNGVSELMQSIGLHLEIKYTTSTGIIYNDIKQDGVYSYILPDGATDLTLRFGGIPGIVNEPCNITITQIPSHAGALCLDGVNDFGKVTGMPIYKDYTFIIDRQIISIGETSGIVASKSESSTDTSKQGAFLFEYLGAPNNISAWSFYKDNGKVANTDFTRGISYQSKYSYNGKDLTVGTSKDSDKLWLGTIRDRDSRFFNGVIYSLMSFPYSMNKFLIERQLKKYKLGTLYPDMVELRPIIKANAEHGRISYYNASWNPINVGDYLEVGARVNIAIDRLNIEKITEIKVSNAEYVGYNFDEELNHWNVLINLTSKSPQKITMTIEQDENYVKFEPIITANSNYNIFYTALLPLTGTVWEKINIGDYVPVGRRVAIQMSFDNEADELVSAVSSQLDNITIVKNSNNIGYTIFGYVLKDKSPQKIDITIDEYIRYEDIVQPYPAKVYIINENEDKIITWGDKLKVGTSLILLNIENLLPEFYDVNSSLTVNGISIYKGQSFTLNENRMVFKLNRRPTYKLDNNEPKCILSPRLLHIPNSSYKILGYIPDISGHGNHGVIHNSAYAEGSGVNEDGSYQFDGVDDFVTIPTTVGGKQVLMKVNWNTISSIIYDQRPNGGFAIYCSDYANQSDLNTVPAYKGRNPAGTTYIDSILNENILASQLKGITHNIVEIITPLAQIGSLAPIIGKSYLNANYSQMALYDFMLFDEISTDDKIKELNEYVGIEGDYVQKPDYYWDAYGKSNLDEDRTTIQQRGIAVGDYDLTNTNFAYDKMSGYGGYEFAKFDNTLDWYSIESNDSVEVVSRNGYSITLKRLTGLNFWYFRNSTVRGLISNDIPFKINSNKNITVIWDVHGLSISEGKDKNNRVQTVILNPNEDNYINLKALTEEELAQKDISTNSLYYLLWFDLSTLAVDEEVTVEMLPLYPNALLFDGVDDCSKALNIVAPTDYTYIFQRELLGNTTGSASMYSGAFQALGGGAFIADYSINSGGATDGMYGYSFGRNAKVPSLATDKIIYGTTTSVNGTDIIPGSNLATGNSITLGQWDVNYKKMAFYKLFLYPRTIDMLSINMVKNMMEEGGIIDITSKLFTDKYTGDYDFKDFNNDFFIGD